MNLAHIIIAAIESQAPGIISLLVASLPSFIVASTNYPRVQGFASWLLRILNALSILTHKDSPGTLKGPLVNSQPPPVTGQNVAVRSITPKGFARVWLLGVLAFSSCAAISWSEPVIFGGPTVAPIEEISGKHPAPAVAAGFNETLGLGQFEFQGKSFDALDLSLLELGGAILPGAGPAGALQLGGEVGSLNGLIGLGILATPYTATGGGFLQGGNPGVTWAAVLNIQAFVSYFDTVALYDRIEDGVQLPRGGLGL